MKSPLSLNNIVLLFFLSMGIQAAYAQKEEKDKKPAVFHTAVPNQDFNIILSRPTDHSIEISIYSLQNFDGWISYKKTGEKAYHQTKIFHFEKEQTNNIILEKLEKNSQYEYRLMVKEMAGYQPLSSPLYHFRTAQNSHAPFSFAIQADSHLDENCDTLYYRKTLDNILSHQPDFMIDLGDTWMTDKYREDFKQSLQQYKAQRYFFGSICHSIPLMLTLGNHDGEPGKPAKKNGNENMAQWSAQTRRLYYSNPYPDGFYTGNEEKDAENNYLQNYYSWEWGGSLFIVLDPFRYTMDNKDPWARTLGKTQYDWLEKTLSQSKAAFKFIFIHNLVGGVDNKGIARGGAEAALFYEWGGKNTDSTDGFSEHRKGWAMPIHDLLKKYQTTAVFHGHDHFFAQQEREGILYQLLPQPGYTRYGHPNQAAEYGYVQGAIMNAPGYLQVQVEENKCNINYFQTGVNEKSSQNNQLLHTYSIKKK